MEYIAKSIQDYKAKIAALSVLGHEIVKIQAFGSFCEETPAETASNIAAMEYCDNLNGTKSVYSNDNQRVESYWEIKKIGNLWIECLNPLKSGSRF